MLELKEIEQEKRSFQINELTYLTIYYAHVESRLRYGCIFWGFSSQETLLRVFRMQKWIIRSIAGKKRRDSCKPLFKEFNLLSLPAIIILEAACQVKQNLTAFSKSDQYHDYPTRNGHKVAAKSHKTTLYEKGPYYSCSKAYNGLPSHILEHKSAKDFKASLRKWLLDKCPYTLQIDQVK